MKPSEETPQARADAEDVALLKRFLRIFRHQLFFLGVAVVAVLAVLSFFLR